MMRAWLFAVLLSGCLQSHDGNTMAIGDRNCVLCHQADYDGTSSPSASVTKAPDHKALGYPTTCADCHVTQANPLPWRLATDHPEAKFSVTAQSPHANIACTSCHNVTLTDPVDITVPVGSSVAGANTDCTSCHLDDAKQQSGHTGVGSFPPGTRYAGQAYAYVSADHRFCLDCHPNGLGGMHNEQIFPSNHKNNGGQCANCHQPALGSDAGGMNAPCVNSHCHTGVTRGEHGDGPNVTDPGPTTCLDCHPHGRGGG